MGCCLCKTYNVEIINTNIKSIETVKSNELIGSLHTQTLTKTITPTNISQMKKTIYEKYQHILINYLIKILDKQIENDIIDFVISINAIEYLLFIIVAYDYETSVIDKISNENIIDIIEYVKKIYEIFLVTTSKYSLNLQYNIQQEFKNTINEISNIEKLHSSINNSPSHSGSDNNNDFNAIRKSRTIIMNRLRTILMPIQCEVAKMFKNSIYPIYCGKQIILNNNSIFNTYYHNIFLDRIFEINYMFGFNERIPQYQNQNSNGKDEKINLIVPIKTSDNDEKLPNDINKNSPSNNSSKSPSKSSSTSSTSISTSTLSIPTPKSVSISRPEPHKKKKREKINIPNRLNERDSFSISSGKSLPSIISVNDASQFDN